MLPRELGPEEVHKKNMSGFVDSPPEVLSVSVYAPSAYNVLGNPGALRKSQFWIKLVEET